MGRVLFDTGQSPALETNLEALTIPIDRADAIVLSHGHYDHTNGLAFALSHNEQGTVYLHPAAQEERYSIRNGIAKSIGLSPANRQALSNARHRLVWTERATTCLPRVHVTGPIPRRSSYEDTGGPFYLDPDGNQSDPICDDQALWIETGCGIIVIVGCAHAGVVNTLNHVSRLSGAPSIHALIGGMHLADAPEQRLTETVHMLAQYDVQCIAPCHCTGEHAIQFLAQQLPGPVTDCRAGSTFCFPDLLDE